MENLYDVNGLVFWTERQVKLRERFRDYFVDTLRDTLRSINGAWQFTGIEAPILTPRPFINKNYTDEDVYATSGNLVLRPETTPGTYKFIRTRLDDSNSGVKPPVCVWQIGKSFRQEQDQVTKNVRLKEFYQLEFQCVFTDDTKDDYHERLLEPTAKMIADMVNLPVRITPSDRLPDYSLKTIDVEAWTDDKWLELASLSLRKDFPGTAKFTAKGKVIEKNLLVAEVAIGVDRCVHAFDVRRDMTQPIRERRVFPYYGKGDWPFDSTWSRTAFNDGEMFDFPIEGITEEQQRRLEGLCIACHGNRAAGKAKWDMEKQAILSLLKCEDGYNRAQGYLAWSDKMDGGMGG
jgi:glycyl-tRNA synthetase